MNVFEKKQQSKVTLDDTVPLSACIETAQKQDDHVVSRVKTALREIVLLFFFLKLRSVIRRGIKLRFSKSNLYYNI